MEVLVGQTIRGYEILEKIGEGGFGVVHKACRDDEVVAIKSILESKVDDPVTVQRFLQEAEIVEQLEHPNILPFIERWVEDERLYFVMPYIADGNLRAKLIEDGAWSLEQALKLLEQLVSALNLAHAQHIVHRDLKPENILFDENKAYVMDFGLAKRINLTSTLTSPNTILGSPHYITPEHVFDGLPFTIQTDIYALGVIIYEVLAGQHPFEGQGKLALMMSHLQKPLPNLPELPEALNEVIQIATAKNVEDRYESGDALLTAFKAAM